ncbi:MAG: hypothetical protein L3J42_04740 [Hydrogenimonas sp.]|nr:hypothetical protein [Hydrogenimonas sp.]
MGLRLFSLAVVILMIGCANNDKISNLTQESTTKRVLAKKIEPKPPSWLSLNFRKDEQNFYSVGIGDNFDKAVEDALKKMKSAIKREIEIEADSKKRGFFASRLMNQKIYEKLLYEASNIEIPKYRVTEKAAISKNKIAVLLVASRKEIAQKPKRELLKKLVPIEQRWHNSKNRGALYRYRVAIDSYEKMKMLLPKYAVADYIFPFSDTMRMRVEKSIPYFKNVARNIRKKLKFCVKKPSSPAMEFFAKAIKRTLERENFSSIEEKESNEKTLCISIKADLKHKKSKQKYIFEGVVKVIFHKPYSDPISIKKYRVYGESKESGIKALQNAANLLEKKLKNSLLKPV